MQIAACSGLASGNLQGDSRRCDIGDAGRPVPDLAHRLLDGDAEALMLAVLACLGVALVVFTSTCAVTSRHPERLRRNPLA